MLGADEMWTTCVPTGTDVALSTIPVLESLAISGESVRGGGIGGGRIPPPNHSTRSAAGITEPE